MSKDPRGEHTSVTRAVAVIYQVHTVYFSVTHSNWVIILRQILFVFIWPSVIVQNSLQRRRIPRPKTSVIDIHFLVYNQRSAFPLTKEDCATKWLKKICKGCSGGNWVV